MQFRQAAQAQDLEFVSIVVVQGFPDEGPEIDRPLVWTFVSTADAWDVLVEPDGTILEGYDSDTLEGDTLDAFQWLMDNT